MTSNPNPIFAKFDQVLGAKTPTPTDGSRPVTSRADEIRGLANTPQQDSSSFMGISQGNDSYPAKVAGSLGDTFKQGGQNISNDISSIGKNAQDAGNSPLAKAAAVGNAAGHVAGNIAGTAGGILGSFISPFVPEGVKSSIGDLSKHISDSVNSIPGMTPEIAKSLGDVFNTLTLKGGAEAEAPAKAGIENAAPLIKSAADTAISKGSEAAGNAVNAVKEGISPSLNPLEAAGQVIQGAPEDVAASNRALSSLDTRGVKTYADLQSRINSAIKPLAEQVDKELLRNPQNGQSIKSFEQTIGEGKSGVKVNYVSQALHDLRDFYTKTNDAKGLSRINSIENNARIKGLNPKDINDLARLHGSDISAFNANGEAASGLTKQAAENTRKGLKEIARKGLGGKEAEALDAKLSDLYDTKSLIDKMAKKVNAAAQKTTKQGIIPKVVSGAVKTVDTLTGNPLKAIGKEIGLGGSQSTMSPLEIEKSLAKNLRVLRGK